jgi:hypothetical protein
MERASGDSGLRWSVVSLEGARAQDAATNGGRSAEPVAGEPSEAKSALDRVTIPQEVLRLAESASPRSSLIISDEELSPETGTGTDFVVLLGGEPQGGIATRRSYPATQAWYPRPRFRLPFWRY